MLAKFDLETIEKSTGKLPIIIECFEKQSLLKFATLSDLPLIQLMWWNNPLVNFDLKEISGYAHGVGPNVAWLKFYNTSSANGSTQIIINSNSPSSPFIEQAHSLDLAVHPYVF